MALQETRKGGRARASEPERSRAAQVAVMREVTPPSEGVVDVTGIVNCRRNVLTIYGLWTLVANAWLETVSTWTSRSVSFGTALGVSLNKTGA